MLRLPELTWPHENTTSPALKPIFCATAQTCSMRGDIYAGAAVGAEPNELDFCLAFLPRASRGARDTYSSLANDPMVGSHLRFSAFSDCSPSSDYSRNDIAFPATDGALRLALSGIVG